MVILREGLAGTDCTYPISKRSSRMETVEHVGTLGITPTAAAFTRVMIAAYSLAVPLNVSPSAKTGLNLNLPQQLILLVAYVKHRRDLLVHTIDYLFLLIVGLHLCWCVLYAFLQNYITLERGGYDGSPTSNLLCQATGVVLIETSANAVLTHVLIAAERWLTVVRGMADTRPYLVAILVIAEGFLVVMIAVQLHSTRQFEPTESDLYCFFPFVARSGDWAPLAGTIMATVYSAVAATMVLSSYSYIYVKVIRASRRAADKTILDISDEQEPKDTASRKVPEDNSNSRTATVSLKVRDSAISRTSAEDNTVSIKIRDRTVSRNGRAAGDHVREVFYRCVAIVCVFLTTYMLLFATMGYRVFMNKSVPGWVDALAAMLSVFDTVITPVMVAVMNKRVAEAVASVVGLRWVLNFYHRGRVQPVLTGRGEDGT
ncbi:hypothetical protein HK101_002592 [Irineochytrium annulatum]|nr:hypothetical protein HK101_002592 [Irineochytrium annulatum]